MRPHHAIYCIDTQQGLVTNYTPGVPAIPRTISSLQGANLSRSCELPDIAAGRRPSHHPLRTFRGAGRFHCACSVLPCGMAVTPSDFHRLGSVLSPKRVSPNSPSSSTWITPRRTFKRRLPQWRCCRSPPLSRSIQSCSARSTQPWHSLCRNRSKTCSLRWLFIHRLTASLPCPDYIIASLRRRALVDRLFFRHGLVVAPSHTLGLAPYVVSLAQDCLLEVFPEFTRFAMRLTPQGDLISNPDRSSPLHARSTSCRAGHWSG